MGGTFSNVFISRNWGTANQDKIWLMQYKIKKIKYCRIKNTVIPLMSTDDDVIYEIPPESI